MRRSGFTMVELIFVIIIIGILSVAAIPKFGDIKDRAKSAAEYGILSSLDSAIEATLEFHSEEDNGGTDVLWHDQVDLYASGVLTYKEISNKGKVLQKIIKKGDDLKVVAYRDLDIQGKTAANAAAGAGMAYDIIFIEGKASRAATGVKQKGITDTNGRPDKNDVWVFNSSPIDINVSGTYVANKKVLSGELVLLDATNTIAYGGNQALKIIGSNGVLVSTYALKAY